MALSERTEDYLEEIFSLEMENQEPSVTAISRNLGVSKASVVSALKKLCEEGYLVQEKYGTPHLTEKGKERALKIFRRHQHLAYLLREIIGIKPEVASEIACAMEHVMDADSEKRLAAFVDFYCLSMKEQRQWITRLQSGLENPEDLSRPLLMLAEGESGRVVRITARELLRKRLLDSGFSSGAHVECINHSCEEQLIQVNLNGSPTVMNMKEAMAVWVLPQNDTEK
jgi:DtxR family Mn-dependent transcriptional regulator